MEFRSKKKDNFERQHIFDFFIATLISLFWWLCVDTSAVYITQFYVIVWAETIIKIAPKHIFSLVRSN